MVVLGGTWHFLSNGTPTTQAYTLSLHDALPICAGYQLSQRCRKLIEELFGEGKDWHGLRRFRHRGHRRVQQEALLIGWVLNRSEEHTSELQSRLHLLCRLLREKKKHRYADRPAL